jgi:pimeloyl-ACP methyl ester carboxylesterase
VVAERRQVGEECGWCNIRDCSVPLADIPLPAGIRSRFVSGINGLTMHVLEAGFETENRPCVLLLHGFPDLAYSWRKVMLPLAAAGFHVIAPDQRGYGRTTGWDADYDGDLFSFRILNIVRDALGLVFALGHRSVAAVVGHDFGSPVAAYCALTRPDVFRSVVMMSAPFAGTPASRFDTADQAQPAQTAPARPKFLDDLAALPRPRKHYHWYYSERRANDNMRNAPQGLPARLLSSQERRLEAEPAVPAERMERGRTRQAADLLRHGPRQGHGRNGRRRDAVPVRNRRVPMADR